MPGRRDSLRQQAYDLIKRDIIMLQLPPGSALTEAELTERYSLGRTPIREALLLLEAEKLVEVRPKRAYFVSHVTFQTVRELFQVRAALEQLTAALACRRTLDEEKLKRLEISVEKMAEAVRNKDYFGIITSDREIHSGLVDYTENRLLRSMAGQVYDQSLRLWVMSLQHLDNLDEHVRNHRLLVELVRSRDESALMAEVLEHLRASAQRTLKYMTSGVGPVSPPDFVPIQAPNFVQTSG